MPKIAINRLVCGWLCLSAAVVAEPGLAETPNLQPLVQGNNAFALHLYGQIRAKPGNLVFSPYSVSSALAMTRAGARGETARQFDQALEFGRAGTNLHGLFHRLNEGLTSAQVEGKIEFSLANSLWPLKQYPLLPEFLETVKAGDDATITPLDYLRDSAAARTTINDWVSERTRHRINDIIPPGGVDAMTRLVLVNAIYFKGAWARPFRETTTRPGDFHSTARAVVRASFMHQADDFLYGENDRMQTLAIRYLGNRLEMLILLPRDPDGLGALESSLDQDTLAAWTSKLGRRKVTVSFPKFKMTVSFALAQPLQSMGLTDAFNPQRADFSGMDGRPHWLYLASVIHKAFIDVNEAGTEAAAATAVTMRATAIRRQEEPRVFNADHPFLFLIRESGTGAILFMGRVLEPERQ